MTDDRRGRSWVNIRFCPNAVARPQRRSARYRRLVQVTVILGSARFASSVTSAPASETGDCERRVQLGRVTLLDGGECGGREICNRVRNLQVLRWHSPPLRWRQILRSQVQRELSAMEESRQSVPIMTHEQPDVALVELKFGSEWISRLVPLAPLQQIEA